MTARSTRTAPKTKAVPRPFALHWGSGQIVEEASVEGEHHTPAIQLLRYDEGEAAGSLSIRFAYFSPRGAFQRAPLIIDAAMVEELRAEVMRSPQLRKLLRRLAGA
jgi:hypothetical protein